MMYLKILVLFSVCFALICIEAYCRQHSRMTFYKREYEKQPRIYRPVPKKYWTERVMDLVLLSRSIF
jgi:hypothetical protein